MNIVARRRWSGRWCSFPGRAVVRLLLAFTTILGGMLRAWYGRNVVGMTGVMGALAGLVILILAGQRRPVPDTVETGPMQRGQE